MSPGNHHKPPTEDEQEAVISRLRAGELLDDFWRQRLFAQPKEAELQYAVKEERGSVLARTMSVPLQTWKQFDETCCVLALRIWLAGMNASADANRADYLAWQVGSGWPAPKHFDRHGGFTRLRTRARRENTSERRQHGQPVTKATRERAEQLRERLRGGTVLPEAVPFNEAVAALLAGPHAVGPPSRTKAR